MARLNHAIVSLNGGEIGKEVLARTQLETYGATAAILENILPEPAGPIALRPGLKYCADLDGAFTIGIPFVYDTQTYGILLSDDEIRIEQNGGIIVRPSVVAAITNGDFPSGLSGWTSISSGSGSAAGGATGLVMSSNGSDTAGVYQAVTVVAGTTHAFRIVVARGSVTCKIGSTVGGSEYLTTTSAQTLRTGTHSIGIVPTSTTVYLQFSSVDEAQKIVTSVAVEASGDLVLPTPWGEDDLRGLRYETSNDVIYFTSGIGFGKRLERRSSAAWSLTDTDERDGPFLSPNTDASVTVAPSVRSGNGTLTASKALFSSSHVGALWKITHSGQYVTRSVTGAGQFTDYIKVQGTSTARSFTYTITGTFSGTVAIQRSIGNTTAYADYTTYTTATSGTITDGLDNQTVYYKIGIDTGDYTSGTAVCTLSYQGGSSDGICRITEYSSATSVSMEVLDPFAKTDATSEWSEGAWSSASGFPKAVALYDGRLWMGGTSDRFWGSVSDAYDSFELGDDAADSIARNIAIGSSKRILAFLPLSRLAILTGEEAADYQPALVGGGSPVVKSSAFDEPLTPSNLTVRDTLASRGVFIDRSGSQAMEMFYSVEAQDYQTRSMMRLHKKIGSPGLRQIAVSKKPDPRIWFVRSDGEVLVKLFDPADNVLGWARIITDGEVESVYVKPADDEDEIMMIVKRTINGATERYLEQLDPFDLDSAADANRVDSYVRREDDGGFSTLSGLGHLEGETVAVWANGASHPTRTVSGGAITLNRSVTSAVTGLSYTGRLQTSKLALGARGGTALAQRGRAEQIAFILVDSTQAIEYGADFTTMDQLRDRGLTDAYDSGPGLVSATTEPIPMPGDTARDPRLCLRLSSPHPVRIAGTIITFKLDERVG